MRQNDTKLERGAILFMAIGAIAALSILALGTTSSVMQELRLAKFVKDSNIPLFEAESILELMKVIWANDKTPNAITLYDLAPRNIILGGDEVGVEFIDEQSKININSAEPDVLNRLSGLSGQSEIIDKISTETFLIKEEVFLVEGVTEEMYAQFKDMVTTYGAGAVNINTASNGTLSILGLSEDVIGKIVEYRAGTDGEQATQDDMVFSFPAEIVPLLEQYGLSQEQRSQLDGLIYSGQLGTISEYVLFNIRIKKSGEKAQNVNRIFNIILNLTTGMVVQWQEL